jgi:anti-anti-sigma factor
MNPHDPTPNEVPAGTPGSADGAPAGPGGPVGITSYQLLGTVGGVDSAELTPTGALDIESAETFRQMVTHMLGRGVAQFLVDLGGLDYIDSTGLGSLLHLYREAKARGGTLRLYNPTPAVQDIFDVTHRNKVLEVHESRQAAIARAQEL